MTETGSAAFGALLRRYRANAGLTQEELAERAGLSVRGISDLERGVNRAPYQATVVRLIEALELSETEGRALEAAISRRRSPPRTERTTTHDALPMPPTSLIGRVEDEARAVHLLRWEGRRLLTLTGTGGVGKTRLALHIASTLAPEFEDGSVFVPLAGVTDPVLVLPAICAALRIREQVGQSLPESLRAYLQDRELLLLLDTFEHLTKAAPLVADLLSKCPKVKVLVTSRATLHLRGEQVLQVAPLGVPAADEAATVAELEDYPSVALFVQRARSVRPDFGINETNGQAVAQICRTLEGIPLAIELAAARLAVLSPEALLSRLCSRLQMLTQGTQDVDVRQQTMRNTIAWSYDLLHGEEQIVFRRLSVMVDDSSLDVAQALCSSADGNQLDVFEVLTSLVDQSLLGVRRDQENDDPRFIMLETLKEFALEKLKASGEEASIRRRHADYYLALAERAEPELRGRDQTVWQGRLDTDHDNLRAVLQWSTDVGEVELGLRVAAALFWFWYTRGYLSEGRYWLERLLVADETGGHLADSVLRAKALRGAATLAAEQGDYSRATALAEEGLTLSRELADLRAEGTLLTVLGNIAKYQADYRRASRFYQDSLTAFRALQDARSISVSLNNLGNIAKEQGEYDRAAAFYEESLAMKWELGDRRGIAIALSNLGTAAHARGDYRRAAAAAEESVAILRELDDKDVARALDTLGRATLALGDSERANDLYREALTVSWAAGDQELTAFCLEGIGRVAGAEGNMELAARLYGAGTALHGAIGAPLSPVEYAQDDTFLQAARLQLGERSFAAEWEVGRRMTIEQAVDLALDLGSARSP